MERKSVRILLADDDARDRLFFKEAFTETGLDIDLNTVSNGVELFVYLNTQEVLPHLIFLDLKMPLKDGLQCLHEIKKNTKYKDVSIAIYSGSSKEDDIENAFIGGANIFIQKPVNFDQLIEILKKAVETTVYYQSPPFNRANFLLRL